MWPGEVYSSRPHHNRVNAFHAQQLQHICSATNVCGAYYQVACKNQTRLERTSSIIKPYLSFLTDPFGVASQPKVLLPNNCYNSSQVGWLCCCGRTEISENVGVECNSEARLVPAKLKMLPRRTHYQKS